MPSCGRCGSSPNGRGNLSAASKAELDDGAGVSLVRELPRHGALLVRTREELLGDEGRSRNRWGSGSRPTARWCRSSRMFARGSSRSGEALLPSTELRSTREPPDEGRCSAGYPPAGTSAGRDVLTLVVHERRVGVTMGGVDDDRRGADRADRVLLRTRARSLRSRLSARAGILLA